MDEDNEAVVRRCFPTGATGSPDALDAIISSDDVLHDPASPEEICGVEGLERLVETYASGVSDLERAS